MANTYNRRRFLQLTGTGTAVSVAGCTQFGSPGDDADDSSEDGDTEIDLPTDGDETDDGPDLDDLDIDPEEGITAQVQPSEEELAELEALERELAQQVQEGEVSQEEMHAEWFAKRDELFEDAAETFESYAADVEDLSIGESIPTTGVFLLDASDSALIETLKNGEVAALLPGERYVEALEQQQFQP